MVTCRSMGYSRKNGKTALATLPASRLLTKTNSKFAGVQIVTNVPYG